MEKFINFTDYQKPKPLNFQIKSNSTKNFSKKKQKNLRNLWEP